MNFRKLAAITLGAAMMAGSLTACSKPNYNLECDKGDQIEHDSDCGYIDGSNQWIWYSWVQQGKVSHSPDNWEPPAGVQIQDEGEESGGGHKKSKKTKKAEKPAKVNSAPKAVPAKPAPKVIQVQPVAPKPVTAKRK